MSWRTIITVASAGAGIMLFGWMARKQRKKEAKKALNLSRIAIWIGVLGIIVTLLMPFTQ